MQPIDFPREDNTSSLREVSASARTHADALAQKIAHLQALQTDLKSTLPQVFENLALPIDSIRTRLQEHNLLAQEASTPLSFIIDALSNVSKELGRLEQLHTSEHEDGSAPIHTEEEGRLSPSQERGVQKGEKGKKRTVDLTQVDLENPDSSLLKLSDDDLLGILCRLPFASLISRAGATNHRLRMLAYRAASLRIQNDFTSLTQSISDIIGQESDIARELHQRQKTLPEWLGSSLSSAETPSSPFLDLHAKAVDLLNTFAHILSKVPQEQQEELLRHISHQPRTEFFRELPSWIKMHQIIDAIKKEADRDEQLRLSDEYFEALFSEGTFPSRELASELCKRMLTQDLLLNDDNKKAVSLFIPMLDDIDLAMKTVVMLSSSTEGSVVKAIVDLAWRILLKDQNASKVIALLQDANNPLAVDQFLDKMLDQSPCDIDMAQHISQIFGGKAFIKIIDYAIQNGDLRKAEELVTSLKEQKSSDQQYNEGLAHIAQSYLERHALSQSLFFIRQMTLKAPQFDLLQEYEEALFQEPHSENWLDQAEELKKIYQDANEEKLANSLNQQLSKRFAEEISRLSDQFNGAPDYEITDKALRLIDHITDREIQALSYFKISESFRQVGNTTRFIETAKKIHIPSLPHDEQAIMLRNLDGLKTFEGTTLQNQREIKKLYILFALSQPGMIDEVVQFALLRRDRKEYEELISLILSELSMNSAYRSKVIDIALRIPFPDMRLSQIEALQKVIEEELASTTLSFHDKLELLEKIVRHTIELPPSEKREAVLQSLCQQHLRLFEQPLTKEEVHQSLLTMTQLTKKLTQGPEKLSLLKKIQSHPKVLESIESLISPKGRYVLESFLGDIRAFPDEHIQPLLLDHILDFLLTTYPGIDSHNPESIMQILLSHVASISDPDVQPHLALIMIRQALQFDFLQSDSIPVFINMLQHLPCTEEKTQLLQQIHEKIVWRPELLEHNQLQQILDLYEESFIHTSNASIQERFIDMIFSLIEKRESLPFQDCLKIAIHLNAFLSKNASQCEPALLQKSKDRLVQYTKGIFQLLPSDPALVAEIQAQARSVIANHDTIQAAQEVLAESFSFLIQQLQQTQLSTLNLEKLQSHYQQVKDLIRELATFSDPLQQEEFANQIENLLFRFQGEEVIERIPLELLQDVFIAQFSLINFQSPKRQSEFISHVLELEPEKIKEREPKISNPVLLSLYGTLRSVIAKLPESQETARWTALVKKYQEQLLRA